MSKTIQEYVPGSRYRRTLAATITASGLLAGTLSGCVVTTKEAPPVVTSDATRGPEYEDTIPVSEITAALGQLAIKGRAPKTGYDRDQFGSGWSDAGGCDTRNRILARDLIDITFDADDCKVLSGTLPDPYTGKEIPFIRGESTSDDVQIDHVVALSNAWQTGAQQLTPEDRFRLNNDPLNLNATEGSVNQQKGDGDAATWLPPNRDYRCSYVARQVLVKSEYDLWVTQAEHDVIGDVLSDCETVGIPR